MLQGSDQKAAVNSPEQKVQETYLIIFFPLYAIEKALRFLWVPQKPQIRKFMNMNGYFQNVFPKDQPLINVCDPYIFDPVVTITHLDGFSYV